MQYTVLRSVCAGCPPNVKYENSGSVLIADNAAEQFLKYFSRDALASPWRLDISIYIVGKS
jgi:hypothetical protein